MIGSTLLRRSQPSFVQSSARFFSSSPSTSSVLSIKSALEQARHAASSQEDPKEDPEITINGWIRSCRKQKSVAFAVINDGSNVKGIQVVLSKGLEEGCVSFPFASK